MASARILVVEDERIIAKGVEKGLKRLGYEPVGGAASGAEAVRQALELRPDLILMDVNLGPGIDGVQAAAEIHERFDVPIVFLTAFSDDATLARAKSVGPQGYLLKPYEDRDLQTTVEIALFRHQVDRRRRENEEWLAATLGSIGDGVIAADGAGRVRFLNALAERLTGWTQAEAAGRDVRDVYRVVHEQTREPIANPALAALEQERPVGRQPSAALVGKDGTERPIEDGAAPIRDAHGKSAGAVLVFRDVTERRRLEEHRRQAEKLEALGRLAGGLAHDFNNIMTIIMGFAELLLEGGQNAEEWRRDVRHMHAAAQRAAALTQQITAFGRKQMLVPAVVDVNQVVSDLRPMIERLLGPEVELVLEPGADLARVKVDPTQLGQAVLGLAAHARDSMPRGGRCTVRTADTPLDAPAARGFPEVPPGRYALVEVSDTGDGLSEEALARVFDPYYTTQNLGRGIGLGLAAVYGIIKQSDGHIHASSRPGGGTTFHLHLPVAERGAHPFDEDPFHLPGGCETILLVEAEATVRRMTKEVLERSGYQVLDAPDGRSAAALADADSQHVDLLIADVPAASAAGRDIVSRLRSSRPELRVLFTTADTEEHDAAKDHGDAKNHGAVAESVAVDGAAVAASPVLRKPFTMTALTQKVREILDAE